MEKYYNEALIGNKDMLATYSGKGELQRMYFPAKDNRQFISFYHVGVKVNDSDLIYLHDDINNVYKQYYEINDSKFKWPSLSHGTFHPENIYYSIIIKSCEQNILKTVFNDKLICKEVNEFEISSILVHLNFIEEYKYPAYRIINFTLLFFVS